MHLYCVLQHAVYRFRYSYVHPSVLASYLATGRYYWQTVHHCLNSPSYSTKKNINILPNIDWVPFPLYFPCHVHALHQSSRPTNTSTVNGTSNSSYSYLINIIIVYKLDKSLLSLATINEVCHRHPILSLLHSLSSLHTHTMLFLHNFDFF